MSNKQSVSKLSEHTVYRKKGKVVTPFNDKLGDSLKLASWTMERMPEYLWLGLILMEYDRLEAFEKIGKILKAISENIDVLDNPKLSQIFNLSAELQNSIYQIVLEHTSAVTLSPLTALYRSKDYPEFKQGVQCSRGPIRSKIEKIE